MSMSKKEKIITSFIWIIPIVLLSLFIAGKLGSSPSTRSQIGAGVGICIFLSLLYQTIDYRYPPPQRPYPYRRS